MRAGGVNSIPQERRLWLLATVGLAAQAQLQAISRVSLEPTEPSNLAATTTAVSHSSGPEAANVGLERINVENGEDAQISSSGTDQVPSFDGYRSPDGGLNISEGPRPSSVAEHATSAKHMEEADIISSHSTPGTPVLTGNNSEKNSLGGANLAEGNTERSAEEPGQSVSSAQLNVFFQPGGSQRRPDGFSPAARQQQLDKARLDAAGADSMTVSQLIHDCIPWCTNADGASHQPACDEDRKPGGSSVEP
eukprot:364786-Chlamydomonas_euryale.AAC.15